MVISANRGGDVVLAEQVGIRLNIDSSSLLSDLQSAIKTANDYIDKADLHKLRIEIDTTAVNTALQNLKTEIANIIGKTVELKVSSTDGQISLADLTAFNEEKEKAARSPSLTQLSEQFEKVTSSIKNAANAMSALKNEVNTVNLGVNADNIANTVKTNGKITVPAIIDPKQLKNSIDTAINSVRIAKPIEIPVVLKGVDKAVKDLQTTLGNAKASVNGNSQVGNLGNVNREVKQTTDAAVEALNREAEAVKNVVNQTNNLISTRKRVELVTNNEYVSERYGTANKSVTISSVNGRNTNVTYTNNIQRQREELDKTNATAIKYLGTLFEIQKAYQNQNQARPITNADSLAQLDKMFQETFVKINGIYSTNSNTIKSVIADVETSLNSLKNAVSAFRNAENMGTALRDKSIGVLRDEQLANLERFANGLNDIRLITPEVRSELQTIWNELQNINANNLTDARQRITSAADSFDALKNKVGAAREELRNVDSATAEVIQTINQLNRISNSSVLTKATQSIDAQNLLERVEYIKDAYRQLLSELGKTSSVESVTAIRQQMSALGEQTAQARDRAKELVKALQNTNVINNNTQKLQKLTADINNFQRVNSGGILKINPNTGLSYKTTLDEILTMIPQVDAANTQLTQNLISQFRTVQSQMKSVGAAGMTLLDELKAKGLKFIKWTWMTMFITKARMYIRQLFTTVSELDEELIDLKKTFQGTTSELEDFYYEANRIAKQMGVTTAEIIKQGAAFSRLGFSSTEAMQTMAEMSSMFASISPDMSVEQAQNGLVSIMKAFGIDPNDVLDGILSKVNIIGNTAATSNGEVVEMLEKSSSAMQEANNTLEQTIALETAAVEITRDASSVGNAFKTVSMRIRGYDEETEEYIGGVEELSGKIADLTKTASAPGGISLFTDEAKTTYKSTYQLLKDISEIYDDLTDKQQAGLLEALAGKRQGQIVAATIKNFGAAEKAMNNMANSAGSAEAEMETIRESVSYQINMFKETFTELAQNAVTRDFMKDMIKAGTGALQVVTNLVKTFGALPTIIGLAAGAIAGFSKKSHGIFKYNESGNLTAFGAETAGGFQSWFGKVTKLEIRQQIADVRNFNKMIQTGELDLKTYNSVMQSSNLAVRNYGNSVLQGADSTKALNTVTKQLKSEMRGVGKAAKVGADGTKQLSIGLRLANAAGSMLISMGLSFAISKTISLIKDMIQYSEKTLQEAKEAAENVKNLESQLEDVNTQLSETKAKILELEKLENPTIIQQEELDKLYKLNDELERTKKILEAQQAAEAYKASDKAMEWFRTRYGGFEVVKNPLDFFTVGTGALFGDRGSGHGGRTFTEAIQAYKDGLKAIDELEKKLTDTRKEDFESLEEYNDEIEKTQKMLDALKERMSVVKGRGDTNYAELSAMAELFDLNTEQGKEYYALAQEYLTAWEQLTKSTEMNLEEIVNSTDFATVKQKLTELWQEGKLTQETFDELTEDSCDNIDEFKKALKDNGYDDFEEVIRAICEYFEETGDNAASAAKDIKTFADAITNASEQLDEFLDKQDRLVSAFEKVKLGGELSNKEIYELLKEFPNLANEQYLQNTGDGWKITAEGIRAVSDELENAERNSIKGDVDKQKEELNDKIKMLNEYAKTVEKYISLYSKIQNSSDAYLLQTDEYKDAAKALKEIKNSLGLDSSLEASDVLSVIEEQLSDFEGQVKGYKFLLDMIDDTFNNHEEALDALKARYGDLKGEVDDFNKNIQTVDSAIKKLSTDSGLLNYDELNELLALDPNLEYQKLENGYRISIDALEELRRQSYITRNEVVDDINARVQAEIRAAKKQEEEYRKQMQTARDMILHGDIEGDTLYQIAADGLEGVNKELEYLNSLLKQTSGLYNDITYEEDENSRDILQDEIDRRKAIIDGIVAVKERYTERLDEEIDVLEESKDALKEQNDELDRELELREALINLENAKKRKVWVYSDGRFVQTQDKQALQEAEGAYRKALQDIQEAEIDKQIEQKEREKEQIEKSIERLENAEDDINSAKAIAQAMQALNVNSEGELLTIPESIKDGLINGLAESTLQKDIEENAENTKYIKIGFDELLRHMGVNTTSKDVADVVSKLPDVSQYKSAASIAESLKEFQEQAVNSVVNNNGGTVINNSFTINDATDPDKIAKVVVSTIKDEFTKVNNAIK